MENDSLLPFERNQYYMGKFLSAASLAAEQRYFNDKRRLVNMACFGFGVVFGLGVTKLDARSVIVSSGLAIDPLGREIALAEQAVVQLSDLEGFDEDADGVLPHAYLCLEYAEEDIAPTHTMVEPTQARDHYDMKREGYRFYISYGEPTAGMIGDVVDEKSADASAGRKALVGGLRQNWRDIDLVARFNRGSEERLFLARIDIVRFKDAYDIDAVEQMPFGQYAASASLLDRVVAALAEASRADAPKAAPRVSTDIKKSPPPFAYGVVELNIPPDTYPNTVLYSDDIVHGFGLMGVRIELALEATDGAIFGDSTVFPESRDYAYAAKADDRSGTFRIGVRVNTTDPVSSLHFRWKAELDPSAVNLSTGAPQIVVTPDAPVLRVRDAVQFAATVYGMDDATIMWEVRGEGHGDILNDGYYTAPNRPGVYEVIARSAADTAISGMAIVTVKDYSETEPAD
jgi:hypothetical protein